MTDVTPPKRDEETAAPETLRLGESESPRLKVASSPGLPTLRLWLPGYHTPSLNVTTGSGWKKYLGMKQKAAGALLDALKERPDISTKVLIVVDALAQGGRLGARGKLIRLGAKQEAERQKKAAGEEGKRGRGARSRTLLTYTRVTCQPLDTENFTGSTKGLTDCLRLAFPQWLPDDAPEFVEILHKQERCRTRDEEGTWVELRLDQE